MSQEKKLEIQEEEINNNKTNKKGEGSMENEDKDKKKKKQDKKQKNGSPERKKKKSDHHKKDHKKKKEKDKRKNSRSRSNKHRHSHKNHRKRESSSSSSSQSSPSERRRKPSKEERILKIMHERRNQSRSKSVIRYYQRQQGKSNPKEDQSDKYWDGFQWVPKTNQQTKAKADNERVLYMTLKMRRIQICNIPTGLTEQEVKEEINKFMNQSYLSDHGNPKPVLASSINEKERTACIELSSVEEKKIKLLEEECKIIRMGEQIYNLKAVSNPLHQSMQQAHNMAQAQAAAINALNNLGQATGIDREEMLEKAGVSTNIIKVGNFLSVELGKQFTKQEWDDMEHDLMNEENGFGSFGNILDYFLVRPHQSGLGCKIILNIMKLAQLGTLFIVYETKDIAEKVVQLWYGRRYNGREFKIVFIQDKTWLKTYKPRQSIKEEDSSQKQELAIKS